HFFVRRRWLASVVGLLNGRTEPKSRSDCAGWRYFTEDARAMQRVRWITLVWPGLTQLWFAGAWWGLALGCGFAWLVNVAVVSSFIGTELIDPWSRAGVWLALVTVWGLSVVLSVRHLKGFDPEAIASTSEDLFRRASREYLSGNWVAAE